MVFPLSMSEEIQFVLYWCILVYVCSQQRRYGVLATLLDAVVLFILLALEGSGHCLIVHTAVQDRVFHSVGQRRSVRVTSATHQNSWYLSVETARFAVRHFCGATLSVGGSDSWRCGREPTVQQEKRYVARCCGVCWNFKSVCLLGAEGRCLCPRTIWVALRLNLRM